MSETVAPSQWEDLTLPNPSISGNKWHYTENDQTGTAKTIEALGAVVTIVGFLLLFGRIGPFPIKDGTIFLIGFIGSFVAALVLLPKISKRVITTRAKKRDEYRAQHAALIIDALGEQGWKVLGQDAVKTIVKDNNPYLVNEDGVRYYARQIYIGPENINIMLTLSDSKVEREIKDAEKNKRIEFEMNVYERKSGPMTPEAKEAFVAALNIAL
jgi:hypothetical protein